MARVWQGLLLLLGGVALLGVVGEIAYAVAATQPGSVPARVVAVAAGPYPLTVRLYKDPAQAGFALPFTIVPDPSEAPSLTFVVESEPGPDVDATPIRASLGPDPQTPGVIQGAAEITVQGSWNLHIQVIGPSGPGAVDIPISASAPPEVPGWLGWLVGLIPVYGLGIFVLVLLLRRPARRAATPADPGPVKP
jgi:hypothetical protein